MTVGNISSLGLKNLILIYQINRCAIRLLNSGGAPKLGVINWKKWELMCSNKSYCVMCFKEFASQNYSFLSEQAWRCLQNPNEYWAFIMRGVYCKN